MRLLLGQEAADHPSQYVRLQKRGKYIGRHTGKLTRWRTDAQGYEEPWTRSTA
jgi:hypothetical protein